jgi:hypothetical protein
MVTDKEDKRSKETKELKRRVRQLEKELARKDKALAETAALLVLKKKLDTLMEEDGDG